MVMLKQRIEIKVFKVTCAEHPEQILEKELKMKRTAMKVLMVMTHPFLITFFGEKNSLLFDDDVDDSQ